MGDSCAQGGKPGIKETGTSEDVPRTAAITHAAGIKKAPADVMGRCSALNNSGYHTRSLNWQRRWEGIVRASLLQPLIGSKQHLSPQMTDVRNLLYRQAFPQQFHGAYFFNLEKEYHNFSLMK